MGQTAAEWLMQQGEKRGEKQGEKRGEKRAELRVKRKVLLKLITTKFGSVSPNMSRKIKAIRSTQRLDALLKKGFTAKTLEEIGLE